MKVEYTLDEGAYKPTKGHTEDAGFDIRTPYSVTVKAHDYEKIDTGVHIAIPTGYVGFLKSKSGLHVNYGITSEGVIDAGYTGSIVAMLHNTFNEDYTFKKGDKITQLVFIPIPEVTLKKVDKLKETERGDNGFGSTGK